MSLFNWVLIILICYISGWLLVLKPIINICSCDVVTGGMVGNLIIKLIFSVPVAKWIYTLGIKIALKVFD